LARIIDERVIETAARVSAGVQSPLIDKAKTPSYVSNAARSCSNVGYPVAIAREVPQFRKHVRARGLPEVRIRPQ